jgi:formylglycine-generating enzyme required for sulfatase activity
MMDPNGPGSRRGNDLPVTNVSWLDVNAFVTALNAKIGLRFDLPTEIQWEYACRAGTATAFSFGESASPELVRFKVDRPAPVASLVQNPWGLRGMHGNVWEWCEDAWTDGYAGNRTDERRVARGGSYADGAGAARSASRKGFAHKQSADHVGFRCVAALPENAAAERRRVRLPASGKPAWAFDAVEDLHGAYAVLEIKGVRQCLRWIPPNSFLMGSPDDERDRYYFEYMDHEIPGKTIVFEQGFWMFDTQCTQELWEAVMGENDSFFRSRKRPVESVSFDRVMNFIERANSLVPGLRLALPSEAQWEYACRAGTSTATYAGPIAELPLHEHPYRDAVLDPIAWYGNNSWEEFDLDYGKVLADHDPGRWPQKYRHLQPKRPAGTHEVGLKKPNDWGLYDMLGNVWEYCADHWDKRVNTAPISGAPRKTSPSSEGEHAIRGGSWYDWAVFCRSPCRLHVDSRKKLDGIGFRCVHPADG